MSTLVTNSLLFLLDLIDVTLALEDANSKLLDVFKVADVDAEDMLTTVCTRF